MEDYSQSTNSLILSASSRQIADLYKQMYNSMGYSLLFWQYRTRRLGEITHSHEVRSVKDAKISVVTADKKCYNVCKATLKKAMARWVGAKGDRT